MTTGDEYPNDDIGPAARMALGADGEYWRHAAKIRSRQNQELRAEIRALRRWNLGLLACLGMSGCLLVAAGVFL